MFRRFLVWLENLLAGPAPMVPTPPPAGPTAEEIQEMVEDAVEQRLAEHTTAIFTAFKAAGVDVDMMVERFSAFQAEVDNTVVQREAAVEAAEAALALAEEQVERAYSAQDQLESAARAMPAPGSIPSITI